MEDLSKLAEGSLTVGSMGASNTISEPAPYSAQLSAQDSELTSRTPQGHVGLDLEAPEPVGTPKPRQSKGYTPSPLTWKETGNG